MKNLILTSVAIFGISISIVQANNANFFNNVSSKLFTENPLSPSEQIELLKLSSESPQNAKKVRTQQSRRNYTHLRFDKRKPFYTKRINRVVDEPSISIVKRKDRFSREKSLRYRMMFPVSGR